tara:strand:+ start:716 stop:952 length:237 start_codon:yes stop_codon:yes gene_type:complete
LSRNNLNVTIKAAKIKSTCQVCGYMARDRQDLESIQKENACTECVSNFKYTMGDLWKSGERPTLEVARSRMNIFNEEV